MRVPVLIRVAYFAVLVTLLSACDAPSQPASKSASAYTFDADLSSNALAKDFRELYQFGGNPDGAYPAAGLVESGGLFFGTTERGGVASDGAIYQISPAGAEKVIHSFTGADGENPTSELLVVGNVLYGTTQNGGDHNDGTVFATSKDGHEHVLHSFAGPDGSLPAAGLVERNGSLYGTTEYGGANNQGTVFAITRAGVERVVYSFGAQTNDGTAPAAMLTWVDGAFYGTTQSGSTYGGGTIFAVSTSGKESTIYRFGAGGDGSDPSFSPVTTYHGEFYGTTAHGGLLGKGTVFAVDRRGVGGTIYDFGSASYDGDYCLAGVIVHRDALYGTCSGGGLDNQGDIFRVTPKGSETVLYSLDGRQGSASIGRLRPIGNYLFGTLSLGGASDSGAVFRFKI